MTTTTYEKPPLGKLVYVNGNPYVTSDGPVRDGDLVLPFGADRAWTFRAAPSPMPFWGNELACRKLVPVVSRA